MLGFKNFASASTTIAGIELLRRIHKRQFALGRLRVKDQAGQPSHMAHHLVASIPWYRQIILPRFMIGIFTEEQATVSAAYRRGISTLILPRCAELERFSRWQRKY
jgi:hypothetical protein